MLKMTHIAPGCGIGPPIVHDAQSKILTIAALTKQKSNLWDPRWDQNTISEAGHMNLGMI